MMNHFTILDVLSIFIASVCHDLEHPGLTNAYQVLYVNINYKL